ncbi:MAG: HlyD family efflux transporter periplasmic adaptor subunit [Planctomycetota bacterium]|nr:HlyD family efflux transporter periplasmic adaptor subunit [Planctomycetota bacterium]
MSTEQQQTPEAHLVDQTRQQIRGLIGEIESLARSNLAPQEFYAGFLSRVVQAVGAEAGAVWALGESGRLELAYQVNLRSTRLADRKEDQERHGRLLRKVVGTGEGMLVQPQSGDGDGQVGNPTDFLLVLGALRSDQEIQGVVEIFQRSGGLPAVERGYLRFLLQMCAVASEYLKTHQLRLFTDQQVMWTQLEQFTRTVHDGLNPRNTAYTIANEGRRLIECDRVSVAIQKGRKCKIQAISGQESFDRRSNTVSSLDRLASIVNRGGEAVWYSGDTSNMPPQIEEAIERYVDESHTKALAILPLFQPVPESTTPDRPKAPKIVGALIIEQITEDAFTPGMMRRIEVVRDHSASALTNSIEHNSLFLLPVWRAIGKSRVLVAARNLPKTLAVMALLVGLVLSMLLIRVDFKLHGKGSLEPVVVQNIYANVPGTVREVSALAEHDAKVNKDDVLLKLENSELSNSITDLVGKINASSKKEHALQDQLSSIRQGSPEAELQRAKITGELQEVLEMQDSYAAQLEIAKQHAEYLTVRSPMTGRVLDWQLREKLISRPVSRGDLLLSIADPTAEWEVALRVPEDRMGHIMRAKNQQTEPLKVEFNVATDPGVTHTGEIKEISTIAEVHPEEGNIVVIKIKMDKDKLVTKPQPGTTVSAKIYCGTTTLGYSLFHDLIAWFQSRVLFRW